VDSVPEVVQEDMRTPAGQNYATLLMSAVFNQDNMVVTGIKSLIQEVGLLLNLFMTEDSAIAITKRCSLVVLH
jgi:hypothetical protein